MYVNQLVLLELLDKSLFILPKKCQADNSQNDLYYVKLVHIHK